MNPGGRVFLQTERVFYLGPRIVKTSDTVVTGIDVHQISATINCVADPSCAGLTCFSR